MGVLKVLTSLFSDKDKNKNKNNESKRDKPSKATTQSKPSRDEQSDKPRSHKPRRPRQKPHTQHRNEDRRHTPSRPAPEPKQEPKPAPVPEVPKVPFSELGLHPKLMEKLTANKFTHATEVQSTSIPFTLSGKNIFCSSETGSGKTLSFLLPMIHKIYTGDLDQALVICPTREIAIQIQKTLQSFEDETLTSALVIGGTNMNAQKKALMAYPKILVATPGRLLDMLDTGLIWLNYTGYVVLDEADRMLDMGFEEDLIKIHKQLTGEHQTILFSATLFPEIKKMAKHYANDYEEIVIGSPTSVAESVEHVLVEMDDKDKFSALKYLIDNNPGKMMTFFNTIRETTQITQQLRKQRVSKIAYIHSKIEQSDRERVIEGFRAGTITALMASDVASRGIDIPNVELVVNFDLPNNSEEYIHRVGRTGRAGKKGIAISFYSKKDTRKLKEIEKLIEGKIKQVSNYRDILGGGSNTQPRHRRPQSNNRRNGQYNRNRSDKPS